MKSSVCKHCGDPLYTISGVCSEPEGIRQDKWCNTCHIVFASHKSGLVERWAAITWQPIKHPRKKSKIVLTKTEKLPIFGMEKPELTGIIKTKVKEWKIQ